VATVTTTQERSAQLNVLTRKQRSLWRDAWYRLIRNRLSIVGLVVIGLALFLAIGVQWIPGLQDPVAQNPPKQLMEPRIFGNPQFVDDRYALGSDQLGRDILSRLLWSARVSMLVGFVPSAVIFLIGISLGMFAGYKGGWIDNLLMRFTDVIYAFPDFLFLIIAMATLRNTALGEIAGGLVLIFVTIAVVSWVGLARLVRGQVLSLKETEFVEAARAIGATPARIMARHLFPNALGPVIVSLAFTIPGAMLAEATLSFLGIGVRPPTLTWGVMIYEGFTVFSTSAWPVLLPGFCISIVMLAFTFVGDGLRDALDPRMKI
jgi:oligopeptide transport system permease protein